MTPRPAARVAGARRTLIRELFESAPAGSVNLGLGEPDVGPPDDLRAALAEAATGAGSGYGATAGDEVLRERIAASYAPFARGAGDVIVAAGCQQATHASIGALIDPGEEVLVPEPGFPGAARSTVAWGGRAVGYPLRSANDFHVDPSDVAKAIGPQTRAVVVVTPGNPTGTAEPRETLDELVAITERRGVALLIDDTYRDFYWKDGGAAPGPPEHPAPHVIVCGSMSKSFAVPGWRVGWIVSPDAEFMARLTALQQTLMTCAPRPQQIAARSGFTEAGERRCRGIVNEFRSRAGLVERVLGEMDAEAVPLEGAFYAWMKVRGEAEPFVRRLIAERAIVIVPGNAFGGDESGHWLRVSYVQPREILEPSLRTIVKQLAALR